MARPCLETVLVGTSIVCPGCGRPPENVLGRRRSLLRVLVALGAVALSFGISGCGVVRAGRLLRDAQRPAHELAGGLNESREQVDDVPVLLYQPPDERGPVPALLLCHGAVEGGARDPRMVSLARAIALRGVLVACPDLLSLRRFRADPEDPARLARVTCWLADHEETDPERGVALLGISIGGSYCLVAAARPEARDRVRTVLVFGGYEDLSRLLTSWMVSSEPAPPGLYDPRVEGRRRVFLGNVESLVPARDVAPARRTLRSLISGERLEGGEPRVESVAGRRLLDCAVSTDPIDPATAEALLAPIVDDLRALSPGGDGSAPSAELFLLHGTEDPVVPPTELERLRDRMEDLGATVRIHETEVFTHVGAEARTSLLGSWSLLRFVARFMRSAGI